MRLSTGIYLLSAVVASTSASVIAERDDGSNYNANLDKEWYTSCYNELKDYIIDSSISPPWSHSCVSPDPKKPTVMFYYDQWGGYSMWSSLQDAYDASATQMLRGIDAGYEDYSFIQFAGPTGVIRMNTGYVTCANKYGDC